MNIIKKQSGDESIKWIKPSKNVSYQKDQKPFEIREEDLLRTMVNYLIFQEKIDLKELKEKISDNIIYLSQIRKSTKSSKITINIEEESHED